MIRDILVLFEYERKRRPELAALAAQISTLSEDQIRAADVPLPWMREALLKLKCDHDADSLAILIEQHVIDGVNADPIGGVRRWQESETFIKIDRSQLLITPGTLIWLIPSGAWIDTIYTMYIDPKLISHTAVQGTMTRTAYNRAVREQARGARLSSQSGYQEPIEQVRFFRPG